MITWTHGEMWAAFAYSLILGGSIGILWDIVRASRLLFSGRVELLTAFFGDIFFFLAAAAVTAIFIFETCFGIARWYALFGETVGFIFYHHTFGRLTLRFEHFLKRILTSAFLKFRNKILLPAWRLVISAFKRKVAGPINRLFISKREVRRQKREYAKLLELCSSLYTKTEEEIHALYTNEYTREANSLLRFRLFDNNIRNNTDKIQQIRVSTRRVERQNRDRKRVDRGVAKQT